MLNRKKLTMLMAGSAFDGTMITLAATGLLQIKTALSIAFPIIVGPASIILALTMGGTMKERMFASFISGLTATMIIVFAATLGTKLTEFIDLNILRILGGLVLFIISLTLFGFKIPERTIPVVLISGLILSIIWKFLNYMIFTSKLIQ